jgi:hypothetical protein
MVFKPGRHGMEREFEMKSHLAQRLRARRARQEFQRAYASGDQSMRQELMALAARQNAKL